MKKLMLSVLSVTRKLLFFFAVQNCGGLLRIANLSEVYIMGVRNV